MPSLKHLLTYNDFNKTQLLNLKGNILDYLFLCLGKGGVGLVQWLLGPDLENDASAGKESTWVLENPVMDIIIIVFGQSAYFSEIPFF